MAVDMFLDIKGDIKGESTDKAHPDTIDVLAWSWGMTQSGSFHMGAGGGAGKVSIQDISVTKYVDSASPILMKFCSNGKHFDEATLIVRKAGGESPLEYLKIKMNKVIISSVSTGGSGGEDRLTENISLNFAQVEVAYTPQLADGSGGGEIPFTWDIEANTEI